MDKLLIYYIFLIALFGGLMATLGIPAYFFVTTELSIVILFLISILAVKHRHGIGIHLWYVLFFFIIIASCSIALNDSGALRSIFSLRLLFRFYFFYLALTTLKVDDETIKRLNVFVMTLLLLQLPVVAYKFHLYGISEMTMGAYAQHGGALTTILPIVVIFYLAAYYFLYEPKRWYWLAGIGFILFSIAGKKRAVFFLYPLQSLAIYYYIYLKGKGASFSRKMVTFILLFALVGGTLSLILHVNDTLNPEGKIAGSVDTGYAMEFAKNYTMHEDEYGYSTGRVLTTIRIFKGLWDLGFTQLFFGLGPGSLTPSIFDSLFRGGSIRQSPLHMFKFKYGVTTATRIAVEYGVLGVVTFILLIYLYTRMCLKYYKYEVDPYWRAFAAGSVGFAFSMMFFFFAYGFAAFWGDTMPALYFYAMAVVYTRLQRTRAYGDGDESLS